MNNRGFSLTELVVVIALVGILLAIATINFGTWQRKYNVESQIKEMGVDLSDVRTMAIATKKEHRVFLTANGYTFRRYSSEADPRTTSGGVQVYVKQLRQPIAWTTNLSPIVINSSGYLQGMAGRITVPAASGSALDCIDIHTARTNVGRLNGSTCEAQ